MICWPRDLSSLEAISRSPLNLRVEWRSNLEPRGAFSLEIRVKEAVHAVRCNGKLAASIDPENTCGAESPQHDVALQQSSVIAEHVVIRTSDGHLQPAVRRQAIVNGADVRLDGAGLGIGFAAVIAHQKQERLSDAFDDDTA